MPSVVSFPSPAQLENVKLVVRLVVAPVACIDRVLVTPGGVSVWEHVTLRCAKEGSSVRVSNAPMVMTR
jgi:hypothetical protein